MNNVHIIYVNDAVLYSLIFKSQKKEAKIFTNWFCNDVLSSLRKHGIYKMNNSKKMLDYNEKDCFYIFKVKDDIFKFGITKYIKNKIK